MYEEYFYNWVIKAKKDLIINPLEAVGMDHLGELLKKTLGEKPVIRAFNSYADDMQDARKEGKLYSVGLTGGLTTNAITGAVQVKGHTFFGK